MNSSDGQPGPNLASTDVLTSLIWELCEGTISESDAARLDSLLAGDAGNRAVYIQFMRVLAGLEHELADASRSRVAHPGRAAPLGLMFSDENAGCLGSAEEPGFSIDSPASFGLLGSHWSVLGWLIAFIARPFPAAICASAATLAGAFLFGLFADCDRPQLPPTNHRTANVRQTDGKATSVAYLASANGCDWGNNLAQLHTVGNGVRSGEEVTLHEGIAEFRLSSGVAISLEGPASLIIASPNSLAVQYGRVTAYVPWEAGEFRLLAGACRVRASEAEFGVLVAGSDVDVHSFSGEVQTDVAGELGVSQVAIAAGQGAALRSSGSITEIVKWHAAEPGEFATKLSMAGPLPITPEYVESVLASKPMHYWRFEECKNRQVPNEIAGKPPLEVVGDLRFVGNRDNMAVEVGRPGSDGFLTSQELFDLSGQAGYSVELWAKPSHVHDGVVIALNSDEPLPVGGQERRAFILEICGPLTPRRLNLVRFLHRDPPGFDTKSGTSCFSKSPYAIRRWQHIAAVKDGQEMRLYLDGQLVGAEREQRPSSLAPLLRFVVGQVGSERRVYPFVGQLDELAIYDHPLSKTEVEQHATIPKLKRTHLMIPPKEEA